MTKEVIFGRRFGREKAEWGSDRTQAVRTLALRCFQQVFRCVFIVNYGEFHRLKL